MHNNEFKLCIYIYDNKIQCKLENFMGFIVILCLLSSNLDKYVQNTMLSPNMWKASRCLDCKDSVFSSMGLHVHINIEE